MIIIKKFKIILIWFTIWLTVKIWHGCYPEKIYLRFFVDSEKYPLCCPCCGNREMVQNVLDHIDSHISEYELICEKCGKMAGYWSYGYWDNSYFVKTNPTQSTGISELLTKYNEKSGENRKKTLYNRCRSYLKKNFYWRVP